jgi:hypothetical protein
LVGQFSFLHESRTVLEEPPECDEDEEETRTRFKTPTAIPADNEACRREAQSRSCNKGEWGEWAGTFTFEDCTIEVGLAYREESPGLCMSANTTTEALAAWCTVTPAEGSCEANYFGQCAFDDDSHPVGYIEYYFYWGGPMKTEFDCTQEGGRYRAVGPQ